MDLKNIFHKKIPEEDPADFVFRDGVFPGHAFLFEDGTFGYVADVDFDIDAYMEEGGYEDPAELFWKGVAPIGQLYIDRWDINGEFHQGGCFLYYQGETFKDYCVRNGEPFPVRAIPEEIIDIFESGDFRRLKKWKKEVPELKKMKL